jgi:hypothetical protein
MSHAIIPVERLAELEQLEQQQQLEQQEPLPRQTKRVRITPGRIARVYVASSPPSLILMKHNKNPITKCAVCLNTFKHAQIKFQLTGCLHEFCHDGKCIARKWCKEKKTCPICRNKIL